MGGTEADKHAADDALPPDDVSFGEVAHAPPKATVKQRLWDGQSSSKVQSSRHAQLMLRQLREAQQTGAGHLNDDGSQPNDDTTAQDDARMQVPTPSACCLHQQVFTGLTS